MVFKSFMLKPLAVAALLAAAGAAQAGFTVYTTQASFLAAVQTSGVDTFTGLSMSATASPLTRAAGSFGYTATTPGRFFGANNSANPWLSNEFATDSITFSNFTGGAVAAIGGNFFGSDIAGLYRAGGFTLVATDSTGATSTQTVALATVGTFIGFVSTGTISSLVFSSITPDPDSQLTVWPTLDNLTLATAVPEPQTIALMLAGLGIVGAAARRRRA